MWENKLGAITHRHFGGLWLAHGDVGESPGTGRQRTGLSTETGHSEAVGSPSSGILCWFWLG